MTMTGENGIKINVSGLQESVVLLFDSSSNVDEIKKFVEQDTKIITFDYETHKILSKNKIDHEISDNYISDTDLQIIQNDSYNLSKWFLEPSISQLIEYEGVNLGKLLHVEFTYFLIKFLKRFLEIIQISRKYANVKFVTSPDLYDIIKSMTNNVTKLEGKQIIFYYDTIKIDSNIANISFNLPRSYYLKLKETSEIITHFLFGAKINSFTSKTALFVEFDAIRFRQIFSLLPQSPLNAILYNQRKPSMWNLTSFSIIKKSGCKIVTSHALMDNKIKNLIKEEIILIETKISSLLEFEEFFILFFSIKELSFWNIIKSTFMVLLKKRLGEYVKEIIIAKQLLKKYKFSSIVIWSEEGSTEQILIKLAKSFKIPTVLIQHGIFYDTPEAYSMNKFQGVFPSEVDKYVVWGKLEVEHAIKYGVTPEKIEPLGSPQYDQFTNSYTKNSKRDFILIATSGFNKEDVRGLTVHTHEKYKETMKKICKIASKTNKKIIIKLHPSPDEIDITELREETNQGVLIIKASSISPLIRSCDVMIMIDLTSVIIEAQLCNKPVISISVKNWWGVPSIFKSKSCISTSVDDLENLLDRIFKDESFRQELIDNGRKFSEQYLSNQGNASQKILDFICKI